jgi:hypothetical protein
LKKKVQKGVKALARPFKKLKTSLASVSTSRSSVHSHSSTLPASNNNPFNTNDRSERSSLGSRDGDGCRSSESEPDVELTPEQQLGMCGLLFIVIHTNYIYIRGTQEELAVAYILILQTQCNLRIP